MNTAIETLITTTNTILYCKKWDETVRFYRDGLQLPVLFTTNWFVEFFLTECSRLSVADEKHATISGCGNAGITLSLQVKDIDTAREFVDRKNLKPTPIKRHAWDALVFYVFDPEGHRLEMWQSTVSHRMQHRNPDP